MQASSMIIKKVFYLANVLVKISVFNIAVACGNPGLVVTKVSKVVGLNPGTVYWMDIFHMYLL